MLVSDPVAHQQPQSGVALELNANQRVTSRRAAKRMRRRLKSALGHAHVSSVTSTCEDGRPLPDTTAAAFAAHEGKMFVRRSGHSPMQQLQQQLNALDTEVANIQQVIRELQLGRPLHLEEQRLHRKALQRDIVLRARDLLYQECKQPAKRNFHRFSARLSAAFLKKRNLTEGAINSMDAVFYFDAAGVAQHTTMPLEELHHGLEGLNAAELERMTVLYNFVMQRQQQQQQ